MGSGASRGPKPTLYIFPISGPCRAVHMVAIEANIPLEFKQIDLLNGEQNKEEFIKINPDHTVPTLVDKDFTLWESRAIMPYLLDTYAPDRALYPRDTIQRARIDRLLYYDLNNVAQHIMAFMTPQLFLQHPADPDKQKEVEKVFEYLENLLQVSGHPYMAGKTLTIADISMIATISFLEVNDWQFSRWPKVEEWFSRMKKQPFYEEANRPFEEFKQKIKRTREGNDS